MNIFPLQNISEKYDENHILNYDQLNIPTELEKGDEKSHSWGKNLSLSLTDTIEHCNNKKDFFVPSTGLYAKIYIEALKSTNNPQAAAITESLGNYWLRTMTLISFPVNDQDGYITHYPFLAGNELARKDGQIDGKVVLAVKAGDFPPLGECVFYKDYITFFDKLFGVGVTKELSDVIMEKFDYSPSVWLAPKISLETSPERMIVFGGFLQYGQGMWLTVNSPDKTIVGTRPFLGVYEN